MITTTDDFWAGHQTDEATDARSLAFNASLQRLLRKHAPKPIVKVGARVWTRWNPRWVTDHECVIYQISAVLCDNNFGNRPDGRDCGERLKAMGWMGVRLEYYAHALSKSGAAMRPHGMVLTSFRTPCGRQWRQWPGSSFNHCGLSVTIAKEATT